MIARPVAPRLTPPPLGRAPATSPTRVTDVPETAAVDPDASTPDQTRGDDDAADDVARRRRAPQSPAGGATGAALLAIWEGGDDESPAEDAGGTLMTAARGYAQLGSTARPAQHEGDGEAAAPATPPGGTDLNV